MRYITRELEEQIQKFLAIHQIIAIVGPRRSGKTTLIQHLQKDLKNSIYLSFEDPKVYELFTGDIDSFIEIYIKKHEFIFLDEFHYAPEGGKRLKYIYDFFPQKKIIISGSSVLEIMIKAVHYLVGRVIHFELLPFSFREFLQAQAPELFHLLEKKELSAESPLHKQLLKYFQEYLIFGGYPEVVLQSDHEVKIKLLQGIYNTYLLREVKDIMGLSSDFKFTRLLKALSLQVGNIINYNELALISGYDQKTVKSRLNALEKTYITTFSFPFYRNKRTEIVKNPKIYFYDSGLRNFILDNFQSLDWRPDKGQLCENYFMGVLRRWGLNSSFWRTKSKVELDFVVQKNGKIIPIEVKCGEFISKIPRAFYSFQKKYDFHTGFLFSLSGKTTVRPINDHPIYFLPLYMAEFSPEFRNLLAVRNSS